MRPVSPGLVRGGINTEYGADSPCGQSEMRLLSNTMVAVVVSVSGAEGERGHLDPPAGDGTGKVGLDGAQLVGADAAVAAILPPHDLPQDADSAT